jgi:hypothetical protein
MTMSSMPANRFFKVGIAGGLLFALMDGLIHANPIAQELLSVYAPLARPSVNTAAGVIIDLLCGLVLAGLFLVLYRSLPGGSGVRKGVSFGLITWFLRVVMQAASAWVMFTVPEIALVYLVVAGLLEMLVLGVLFGAMLEPGALPFG